MSFPYCPRCATPMGKRTPEDDDRERAVCPSCGFVHYDNPTPVVGAIVQHGDDVVLVQNKGWPGSWFGLVTGFLERGEHPDAAVLREVEEELLVPGELVSRVGLYAFEQANQLIIAYHVRIDGAPQVGPELEAIKSVPIAKLKPWPVGTGDAVRDWLADVRPD